MTIAPEQREECSPGLDKELLGTHSGHRGGRDQDQQRSNKISAGGRVGVDDVTHPLLYRLNV
jgi:hypothetical protein